MNKISSTLYVHNAAVFLPEICFKRHSEIHNRPVKQKPSEALPSQVLELKVIKGQGVGIGHI